MKEAVTVPVIGNGDIFTVEDGMKLLNEIKCDGIMVGRGSLGNPWLFKRLVHYIKTGDLLPEPTGRKNKYGIETFGFGNPP